MQFTKTQVESWQDGWRGFLQWTYDVQIKIPGPRGPAIVFEPAPFQVDAIKRLLACKENGDFQYQTIGLTWPRRHSKTTIAALLCLWRLCTRVNENILALSNSERQTASVGFGLCRRIALATPGLRDQIGVENIQQFRISVPALGSQLRTVSGNLGGLYGERVTVAWISELHAAQSDQGMQILASSLGDSENSWLLIDSTTDGSGGPLHRLEQLQESGEDSTICIDRLEYVDLDDALARSPSWIRRDWLKSRAVQLLPATFASQHLNQRQGSEQNLFSFSSIQACQDRLPHPMTRADLEKLAQGRNYAVGAGLDRAFGFSLHGDKTVLTVAAKISGLPGQEPDYYILQQESVLGSLGRIIKQRIKAAHTEFNLQNCIIESYNSQDIHVWAIENNIPSELVHATATAQVPAFSEFYRIVSEGRLHFSDKLEDLAREMAVFQYELRSGSPKFGSDRHHDDFVYSTCWALHALRQQELASFVLNNIVCTSRSSHANCCFLRGGDLVLPCSNTCQSSIQVQQMFNMYRHSNVETEISMPEFFSNLVTVDGVHIFS